MTSAGIGGSGTEEAPYQIATAEQLYTFADWYNKEAVLADKTWESGVYAELTDNIDLNPGFTFNADGT